MKPFSNNFNENWDGINRKKRNLTEEKVTVHLGFGGTLSFDISTDQGIIKALEAIWDQRTQMQAGDSYNISPREREANKKNLNLEKELESRAKKRKLKAVYRGIGGNKTVDYSKPNPWG